MLPALLLLLGPGFLPAPIRAEVWSPTPLPPVSQWAPARWTSNDPGSLDLLAGTPVNCLLVEQPTPEFAAEAAGRRVAVLGVIHPGSEAEAALRRAVESRCAGAVLEGSFAEAELQRLREISRQAGILLIELPPRSALRLDAQVPVVGTNQGLWPGIRIFEDGAVRAAPTGGPWVETNSGFLRYLRAVTDAPVWIANLPPPNTVLPVERYLAAVADAAIAGARWVVALDPDLDRRLHAREAKALKAWSRLAAHLKFYEDHGEWRSWRPAGQLALIQDADSGALLSGGVMDMIAARHIPFRALPRTRLDAAALNGVRIAVNVDPSAVGESEKQVLRAFTRSGGLLLSGPPGWKFPTPEGNRITLEDKELEQLGEIWREVNSVVGRRNLGARLFNVAGMLSNFLAAPDGRQRVLHLVNYTLYPAEDITVHLAGKYARARLLSPEAPPRELRLQDIEEGVSVEIDRVATCAALLLEAHP